MGTLKGLCAFALTFSDALSTFTLLSLADSPRTSRLSRGVSWSVRVCLCGRVGLVLVSCPSGREAGERPSRSGGESWSNREVGAEI